MKIPHKKMAHHSIDYANKDTPRKSDKDFNKQDKK